MILKSIKVLVVEDNPGDALLIEEMLKEVNSSNPFETKSVALLSEALKLLNSEEFQVVLLDLNLPDSNGFDTFNTINNLGGNYPIIILTGISNEDLGHTIVRMGAQDYLQKGSVDSELLSRTIRYSIERTWLRKRMSENELKFRRLFDYSRDAIIIIDSRGIIIDSNNSMNSLVGYSGLELIGKELVGFISPKDEFPGIIDEILSNGYARFETNLLASGNMPYHIEVSANTFKIGDVTNIQFIIRDISERKIAEKKMNQSLKEKELLLKEIHHRVKNNLQIVSSLLNLQVAKFPQKELKEALKESQNRIRTMALVHQNLYQSEDIAYVGFEDYLKKVCQGLFRSFGANSDKIKLIVNNGKVKLGIDYAIPCGLIVNELLSNSLKHAFKNQDEGEIIVSLYREENNIILSVQDNGTPLLLEHSLMDSDSLGLQLVKIIAEDQLYGNIAVDTSSGTKIVITFSERKIS